MCTDNYSITAAAIATAVTHKNISLAITLHRSLFKAGIDSHVVNSNRTHKTCVSLFFYSSKGKIKEEKKINRCHHSSIHPCSFLLKHDVVKRTFTRIKRGNFFLFLPFLFGVFTQNFICRSQTV